MTTAPSTFYTASATADFDPRKPRQHMHTAYDAVWDLDSLPYSLRMELQEKIRRACSEAWTRGYRTADNTFREDLADPFPYE